MTFKEKHLMSSANSINNSSNGSALWLWVKIFYFYGRVV